MSDNSKIEWTDATWNPVRGCSKVSPGCVHCYAETFAERFRGVPGHPFEFGFDLRLVPEKLGDPIRWSKPKKIFVNSMSDLFHEDVPGRIHRESLPGDAGGELAHLPDSHQAGGPHGGIAARQAAASRRRRRTSGGASAWRTVNMACRVSPNCEAPGRRLHFFRLNRSWKTSANLTCGASNG